MESFPRRFRLGSNNNYRFVYRRGRSTPSRSMTLVMLKGKEQKFGFSVSSKVGHAVTRNRLRRWMREWVRKSRTRLKCGKYIIVARPSLKDLPHDAFSRELEALFERANAIRSDSPKESDTSKTNTEEV